MRFNKQLIEFKSVLEDKKKWIDEKSNKWIQLKLYSFNYYRFKIEDLIDWLIDWVEKLNSNGLIDGLVVEVSFFPIGINEHVLC